MYDVRRSEAISGFSGLQFSKFELFNQVQSRDLSLKRASCFNTELKSWDFKKEIPLPTSSG